jgi:hypothetical protein
MEARAIAHYLQLRLITVMKADPPICSSESENWKSSTMGLVAALMRLTL